MAESPAAPSPKDGLVLYKGRPARVKEPGSDRLIIQLADGATQKVRPKDITHLHDGPCDLSRLPSELDPATLEEADGVRELLLAESAQVTLHELAGFLFADPPTPADVWCSWRLLEEGLLFSGTIDQITPCTDEAVQQERDERNAAAASAAAWKDFVERVRQRQVGTDDADNLREVEAFAEGRTPRCRLLKELGRGDTVENAHALLLEIGWWDVTRIPHLRRHDLPLASPETPVPPLPDEERLDLTHLQAWAIDDEGNTDPDDAVSIEPDGHLWIHVADVAALAPTDSPLDLEARGRGATLYLPTAPITMLPHALVQKLGLGLRERSPALSFRVGVDPEGHIADVEIAPSWIRVERLSYAAADARLHEEPLAEILSMTQTVHERRLRAGALDLRWPEARIRVDLDDSREPQIQIQPLQWLRSRDMVAEAMILAGEAAARYAADRGLPFPFSTQEAPDPEAVRTAESIPAGPAADFARRRCQRPGRVSGTRAAHAGLGVSQYARATSPMRRYLDLVAHQQLRAALGRGTSIDAGELVERVGAAEAIAGGVRGGEADARRHWTLVYLQQRSDFESEAVLVDTRGRRGILLIPALALETSVPLPAGAAPGDRFIARPVSIDLPRQDLMLELAPIV